MTERKQMSVDIDTVKQADRCAAILTLRLERKITRIGAVRIALAELEDKLEEDKQAARETAADRAGGPNG